MTKCSAIIQFGDDYGDNETTFHCQLDEGHSGGHSEIGKMYGKCAYKLEWDGDMIKEKVDESRLDLIQTEEIGGLPTVMETI